MRDEQTYHYYDDHALTYQQRSKDITPLYRDDFMSALPDGATVLDLGCGPGRDSGVFVQHGFSVLGVDMSPAMIELAKQHAPRARFVVADAISYAFGEGVFDGIWASGFVVNFPKSEARSMIQKLYRALRAGGTMYLNYKIGEGEGVESDPRHDDAERWVTYFTEPEMDSLVKTIGFSIKQFEVNTHPKGYKTWGHLLLQK